jgi:hypothetical protein
MRKGNELSRPRTGTITLGPETYPLRPGCGEADDEESQKAEPIVDRIVSPHGLASTNRMRTSLMCIQFSL